jgi:hypothetical protein
MAGVYFPGAMLLGRIAHKEIQDDYISQLNLVPGGDVYMDDPYDLIPKAVDEQYSAFLLRKNPGLNRIWAVALSVVAMPRPDMLVDRLPLLEFEEIKSDSAVGQSAGLQKRSDIRTLYYLANLPYVPGTTYVPPHRIDIRKGTIRPLKLDFEVTLKVMRFRPGILTYEYCITTDWNKVRNIALVVIGAIVAAIIAGIVGGRLPGGFQGLPNPVPLPPGPVPITP